MTGMWESSSMLDQQITHQYPIDSSLNFNKQKISQQWLTRILSQIPNSETSMQSPKALNLLTPDDSLTNFADDFTNHNQQIRLDVFELIYKTISTPAKHRRYRKRIKILSKFAEQDEFSMNSASQHDFWQFVSRWPHIRQGNLALLENGNLRAVWKDEQGAHLGLQFLGASMVQYVIFNRRKVAQEVSRVAGRDTIDGLEQQIQVFDLNSLLYE